MPLLFSSSSLSSPSSSLLRSLPSRVSFPSPLPLLRSSFMESSSSSSSSVSSPYHQLRPSSSFILSRSFTPYSSSSTSPSPFRSFSSFFPRPSILRSLSLFSVSSASALALSTSPTSSVVSSHSSPSSSLSSSFFTSPSSSPSSPAPSPSSPPSPPSSSPLLLLTCGTPSNKKSDAIILTPPSFALSYPINYGEDAAFVSSDSLCFGVSDGVGGYQGGGSAKFSLSLCEEAMKAAAKTEIDKRNPVQIMNTSWLSTLPKKIYGGCTSCILSYNPSTSTLSFANLGDSGFIILHPPHYNVIYSAPQKQHPLFNCPYQLGPQYSGDMPKDSHSGELKVYKGDIILVATDGVWDNIWFKDIEDAFRVGMRSNMDEELAAYRKPEDKGKILSEREMSPYEIQYRIRYILDFLVQKTSKLSADRNYISPFAAKAKIAKQHESWHKGGKYDDVTMMIGKVMEGEEYKEKEKEEGTGTRTGTETDGQIKAKL